MTTERTECARCGASLDHPIVSGYICGGCGEVNDDQADRVSDPDGGPENEPAASVDFCPECGEETHGGRFCVACGAHLEPFGGSGG